MKWYSHKLTTGAIMYAITGNPIAAYITAAGSIIPDAVEGFPDETNYNQWRKNHRRLSHWAIPYFIAAVVLYLFASWSGGLSIINHFSFRSLSHFRPAQYAAVAYIFSLLSFGAVCHVIEDAICGKVPALDPKERIGVKLFYVGSPNEYLLVIPFSLALIYLRYLHGS